MSDRPRIVCLCGSTRFMEAWQAANLSETLAGRIVLSIGCNTKSDADLQRLGELTPEKKAELDELHKRKIDLADEILVLNVLVRKCPKCGTVWRHDSVRVGRCSCGEEIGDVPPVGYVGSSTRGEIEYAKAHGKAVRWLEPDKATG